MGVKRLFDLLLTVPGLLLLSPLLLLIAIWIKLDSEGPVLYRQVRVGRRGIYFKVLKFRTMIVDADKMGLKVTVGHDPRITKAGLLLRKYKLDELPQLFNVLKGEMSLVGPRPEVPEYMTYYPEDIRKEVLSVPPGLTDYAAVEFCDENEMLEGSPNPNRTYIDEILPRKQQLYLKYVRERSLLGDIQIIFRTIFTIVR